MYKNTCLDDLPGEEWRDVLGFEGRYSVSSLGRVKSLPVTITYTRGHTQSFRARILKQYDSVGYLKVDLYRHYDREKRFVHALVAEAFIPNPDNKPTVNHKKGDRKLNMVNELEWATYTEQHHHAHKILGRPYKPKKKKP